jgi:hypothetical protein
VEHFDRAFGGGIGSGFEFDSGNDSHIADVDNVALALQAMDGILPVAAKRGGMLPNVFGFIEIYRRKARPGGERVVQPFRKHIGIACYNVAPLRCSPTINHANMSRLRKLPPVILYRSLSITSSPA